MRYFISGNRLAIYDEKTGVEIFDEVLMEGVAVDENDEEDVDEDDEEENIERKSENTKERKSNAGLNLSSQIRELILAGEKNAVIIKKTGCKVSLIYAIRHQLKKGKENFNDGKREEKKPYGRTLAEIERNAADIDPKIFKEVQDLRDQDMTTSEIVEQTGYPRAIVERIPARPHPGHVKFSTKKRGRPAKVYAYEPEHDGEEENPIEDEDDSPDFDEME